MPSHIVALTSIGSRQVPRSWDLQVCLANFRTGREPQTAPASPPGTAPRDGRRRRPNGAQRRPSQEAGDVDDGNTRAAGQPDASRRHKALRALATAQDCAEPTPIARGHVPTGRGPARGASGGLAPRSVGAEGGGEAGDALHLTRGAGLGSRLDFPDGR